MGLRFVKRPGDTGSGYVDGVACVGVSQWCVSCVFCYFLLVASCCCTVVGCGERGREGGIGTVVGWCRLGWDFGVLGRTPNKNQEGKRGGGAAAGRGPGPETAPAPRETAQTGASNTIIQQGRRARSNPFDRIGLVLMAR